MLSLTLSGCEFSFGESGEVREISGYTIFEENPLAGVKIQSDFNVYATTDENGYYSFVTRAVSLTIYAKKSGYSFEPKTITIEDQQSSQNFIAVLAENLTGTLCLNAISIAPTSISSLTDNNYTYQLNSTPHLKIAEFVLKFNQESIFHRVESAYLQKNKFTNICNQSNFEFEIDNGITNFTLNFQLKANFKYNYGQNESVSIEPAKILNVGSVIDTGSLNQYGQVKFIASGINSIYNGFTYDIQFIFDFIK